MTIFTILVYLCYLVFQLFSHKNLYDYDHSDVQQSVQYSYKRLHFFRHKMTPADWDVCSLEAGSEKGQEEKPEMGLWMAISLHVILTAVCRQLISLAV
jgi:Ca2+/H+ antiporter